MMVVNNIGPNYKILMKYFVAASVSSSSAP